LSSVKYPEIWRCEQISLRRYRISRGRRGISFAEMRLFPIGDVSSPLEMRISRTRIHISRRRRRISRGRCGGISILRDVWHCYIKVYNDQFLFWSWGTTSSRFISMWCFAKTSNCMKPSVYNYPLICHLITPKRWTNLTTFGIFRSNSTNLLVV
jgi:hypothetical protein